MSNSELREKSRELDCVYSETDRLYGEFARSCGLSYSAYWIMYDIEVAGGSATVRYIREAQSGRPQTVNSSLKSLESKGLISLEFEEGSRKNKVASFTDAGRTFSQERIVPAINAEAAAFGTLCERDQEEIVRLTRAYAMAVREQLEVLLSKGVEADG